MGPALLGQIVVSVIVGAVLNEGLTLLTSALTKVSQPKKSAGTPQTEAAAESQLGVVTEPNGPQIGIFGRGRVGARCVLSQKASSTTYKALVLAGAPLSAVNAIYMNNGLVAIDGSEFVTTAPWKAVGKTSSYKIKIYTGAQTTVDADLKAAFGGWTDQMIGYKQTYLRCEINPSVDAVYATVYQTGEPDVSADVNGFACYDPRDVAQDVNNLATWTFTKNAALIAAGYLVHELGRNLPVSRVDWNSVSASADICDQQVDLANGLTESRYECFIVWKTDERHEEVISRIENAMAGRVYRIGAKYVVEAGRYDVSGATDIVPDDYANDGLAFADTTSIDSICNGVRGQFASPSNNYEMRDYPAYQDAAALAEDNGLPYWLPVDFPAVTSPSQAQRLARIAYRRARYGAPASVDLKFKHFDVVRGDWVRVIDPLANFATDYFRVEDDKLAGNDFTITLELTKEAANTFDWAALTDELPMPPAVNLNSAGGVGVNPDDTGPLQPCGGTFHVQAGSTRTSWTLIFTFFDSPSGRATDYGDFFIILGLNPTPNYSTPQYAAKGAGSKSLTFSFDTSNYSSQKVQLRAGTKAVASGEEVLSTVTTSVTGVTPSAMTSAPYTSASTTPFYFLPPPPAPQIASLGTGSGTINYFQGAGGTRTQNIELWENTTNNFATATKIKDVANANGSQAVSGSVGSTKYYWTRTKNVTDSKFSPVSNVLLVGF